MTISFFRFVCPFVHPQGTTRDPLEGFSWNLISEYFSKICRKKFKFLRYLTRITGILHEDQYTGTIFIILHAFLLRKRNFWNKSCKENQNTHFRFNNVLLRNPCRRDIMWKKYCRARQTTDDTTAYAHWMLDTYGYKHTPGICNNYCFSPATMVALTRLYVTLYYAHCLLAVFTSGCHVTTSAFGTKSNICVPAVTDFLRVKR